MSNKIGKNSVKEDNSEIKGGSPGMAEKGKPPKALPEEKKVTKSPKRVQKKIKEISSQHKEEFEDINKSFSDTGSKKSDFIKKNMETLLKASQELNIADLNLGGTPQKNTSSNKSLKSSQKSQEKQLLLSPASNNLIDRLEITSEKVDKELTSTLLNLDLKDQAINKLLMPKEKIEIPIESRSPDPLFRRNSAPKVSPEKTVKRSASKQPEQQPIYEITTSIKSQSFLANRFIKEFNMILKKLSIDSNDISLSESVDILQELNFIKNDSGHGKFEEEKKQVERLWFMIAEGNSAKVQNLLSLCLNIMNLYTPDVYLLENAVDKVKTWKVVNGIYVFSQEEALKIHKNYFGFYQNRQLKEKVKQKPAELAPDYTFKPKINPESEYLALDNKLKFGSLNSEQREEYLERKRKEIERKREKRNSIVIESQTKDCTFKPTLLASSFTKPKSNELSNKALSFHIKRDNSPERCEPEKEEPCADKGKPSSVCESFYSHRVQKEIQRMKKAREDKDKKQQLLCEKNRIRSNSTAEAFKPKEISPIKTSQSPKKVQPRPLSSLKPKVRLEIENEVKESDKSKAQESEIALESHLPVETLIESAASFPEVHMEELSQPEIIQSDPPDTSAKCSKRIELELFIKENNLPQASAEKLFLLFNLSNP